MAEQGQINEARVLEALAGVQVPQAGGNLVSLRLVGDVKICDGNVAFDLRLPALPPPLARQLHDSARAAVQRLPGVSAVNVRQLAPQPQAPQGQGPLPGVRHVIAVGSGKGGVGKSTVAVNLAVALARDGARVGLLDADVYGPSIPQMMGIHEQPDAEGGKMVPLERFGVKLMSLGFLMPDNRSHVIWRGPMVAGAVRQMLVDCRWGELDYLLVDLPPGTGDAQLTLAQTVPLSGAVVVMTSQDVAVNIASKAVGMFQSLNVPILGVIGNMDTFACPHCGEMTPIFTRGGSEDAARRLGVPFLGSVPLDPATVEHGDQGIPTVLAMPESETAAAFRSIAATLAAELGAGAQEDPFGGLFSSPGA